jgi:large subunit ribosomal protein L5
MNLKETFNKELLPQLQEKLGIDNVMAVPKLTKVVINMGVGEALTDKKHLESAVNDLESIAGQKAVITKAKKSVASFKLREGWPVGCKVTLRGDRMYDFIERLVNVAIPRERDFRGLNPKSFDGQGNYSMGIKSKSYFLKLTMTTSIRSEAWIYALIHQPLTKKMQKHC